MLTLGEVFRKTKYATKQGLKLMEVGSLLRIPDQRILQLGMELIDRVALKARQKEVLMEYLKGILSRQVLDGELFTAIEFLLNELRGPRRSILEELLP